MANDTLDRTLFEPAHGPVQRELLLSAVLHLMSHYTAGNAETKPCARLASAIQRHLEAIADLPDLAPVLRATCEQLADMWAVEVAHSIPQPKRANLFARLATGAVS